MSETGCGIRRIRAREILDGKARPLLEVDVLTNSGVWGRATAPSGLSVGGHEALTLRDGDEGWYAGEGVSQAAANVQGEIAAALGGMDVREQKAIDRKLIALDGTPDKSRLGGNALYAVSLACLRAASALKGGELCDYVAKGAVEVLPYPCAHGFYSIKGGLEVQECGFIPCGAKTVKEAVAILTAVCKELPRVIGDRTGHTAIRHPFTSWQCPGDDPLDAFSMIAEAARRCGAINKIAFYADFAADSLYDSENNVYCFRQKRYTRDRWLDYLEELTNRYPFLFMEDPLHEEDWEGWGEAKRRLKKTNLIGDDLTVTQAERVEKAAALHACAGMIFKPNQAGTVTESLRAASAAGAHGMMVIPSVRSGETASDPTAEFGVGLGCCAIKCGPTGMGAENHCISTLLRAEDMHPNARLYDITPLQMW